MRKLLIFLLFFNYIFAQDFSKVREENIKNIDLIIKIYKKRLDCIEESNQPKECIKKFPYNQKSDNLASLLCSSFPVSYYKNILKRDIKMLQNEKICWGKALSKEDVAKCIKN